LRISVDEFAARREALAARLEERGLSGCVLFDTHYVSYYTGFAFIPTERPIAFALATGGRGGMLVPRLEVEHAHANAAVSEVAQYDEVPRRAASHGGSDRPARHARDPRTSRRRP
jgi:Xaa-Pro dipeptidase